MLQLLWILKWDLNPAGHSWSSYLVLDLGEDGAGPVEEPLGEPHLVLVVLVAPLAHCGVLPFLEPLVLHHGQDGHAGLPCGPQKQHCGGSSWC